MLYISEYNTNLCSELQKILLHQETEILFYDVNIDFYY